MKDSEETIKLGGDSFDNPENLGQHLLDRPLRNRWKWHQQILERYEDGRLVLHFHVFGKIGNTCVRAEAASVKDIDLVVNGSCGCDGPATAGRRDGVRGVVDFGTCDQQQPMLVRIYEFMEPPQRRIRSVIRLYPLDGGKNICGAIGHEVFQLRKTIRFGGLRIIQGDFKERESGAEQMILAGGIERRIEPFQDDLKHHMIEDGSGVGKKVADEQAQCLIGLDGDVGTARPTTIDAFLSSEFVRIGIDIPDDFSFDFLQVLLCPDDFEFGAVERMAHE